MTAKGTQHKIQALEDERDAALADRNTLAAKLAKAELDNVAMDERVHMLHAALQMVQAEIDSSGETGTEIAFSNDEHDMIRSALSVQSSQTTSEHGT